jgi:uncharacterized damage-inducible protein DinB
MGQSEREQYLAVVRSTPDRLKGALAGVPKRLLAWRPAPGKWSIHEIVCHLRDAERLGYLYRYERIVAEENPRLPNVEPDRLALERQYGRMSFRETLQDWRAARKASLAILKKVKADQWARVGTHELYGPLSLEEVLRRQAVTNDEVHLIQIEHIKKRWEVLARLTGAPKALAAVFRGAPDEVVRRKPAPDAWSMLEILCHLRDVECLFVERYAKVASQERPEMWLIDQSELAVRLKYNDDTPALALKEFTAFRQQTVALLSALPHQAWHRVGRHPKRGDFSIAANVELQVGHDAKHLDKIRALRAEGARV